MKVQSTVAIALTCVSCIVAGPPGKNTIASSDAMTSLQFMLKYLPVTVAEDNGVGNVGHGAIQGRVQTLRENSYSKRNCQLYSAAGSTTSSSSSVSMTSNGLGKACSFSSKKDYGSSHAMHAVFAFNQVQCCNACVATDGCSAATFHTSNSDHSGGRGPQSWEGFGIHQPDVQAAKTTGGLSVDDLEKKYIARLGDHSVMDAFMDYSATFFTYDLQSYLDAFKADGIQHFTGQWLDGKDTWYSLIFRVPGGTYVLELVSKVKPSGVSSMPQIEQRMSSAQCSTFSKKVSTPANEMLISSINRASSDLDGIDDVYTNLFKSETSYTLTGDVSRRCYKFSKGSSSEFDVCFTNRKSDSSKDEIFSVKDHEENLWAVHAGTMGNNPSVSDKMTDSHGGYSISSSGISALKSHFKANDPFPITSSTRLAYACFQSYVIDPTGFSIQTGGPGGRLWPKCGGDETLV